jgi:Protein of unknown function (DUF2844)
VPGQQTTLAARARLTSALCVAIATLVVPASVSATLGRDASSVDADRVRMQGALIRIARDDAYTVHEMQSSSGTAVREYVSSTGTVFAVAWQGPWLPDLRQLLGPYFDDYQRALQAPGKRKARGPLTIELPDLTVQITGHPRAFSGRAFVPRLMPLRVQAEAIR